MIRAKSREGPTVNIPKSNSNDFLLPRSVIVPWLMAKSGPYSELYSIQAAAYR